MEERRVAPVVLSACLLEEGDVTVKANERAAGADLLEDEPSEITRTAADVQHAGAW